MNNRFEIRDNYTAIFLKTKDNKEVETLISTIDLEKVRDFIGNWYPVWNEGTQSYYVLGYGGLVNEEKKTVSLHRWIMDEPEGFVVDHANHNTLDNRYGNLRIVSNSVNALNRKKAVGVTKYKDKWKAVVKFRGERITIGYFQTEKEAQDAVDKVKEEMIEENTFIDEYKHELKWFNKQVRGLL